MEKTAVIEKAAILIESPDCESGDSPEDSGDGLDNSYG